ncbi:hypothetical protein ACFPAG_16380 [Vogesella sp. GCM10023246]|uniref:Uncharacterized protein n=1 Tax=Vogesella oryzagri TaxID=3160864 RepID=A0ABV1MB45_9NEIS
MSTLHVDTLIRLGNPRHQRQHFICASREGKLHATLPTLKRALADVSTQPTRLQQSFHPEMRLAGSAAIFRRFYGALQLKALHA